MLAMELQNLLFWTMVPNLVQVSLLSLVIQMAYVMLGFHLITHHLTA